MILVGWKLILKMSYVRCVKLVFIRPCHAIMLFVLDDVNSMRRDMRVPSHANSTVGFDNAYNFVISICVYFLFNLFDYFLSILPNIKTCQVPNTSGYY